MSTDKKSKKELLRQRAEKLLSKESPHASKMEDKDLNKLVHELQVHQVELEMQNEELREAQEEIEESRQKYSDLYDFAPIGYFTFDPSGMILEVNLTGASLLGIEREKLIRRPFAVFMEADFLPYFFEHCRNTLNSDRTERCELKLIRKDGKSFYASLQSTVAHHGGSFRIRSAVSDITELRKAQTELNQLNKELEDRITRRTAELETSNQQLRQEVSERKRTEQALQESELKYRELIENANSIIIRMTCDGTITFFNEYAQRFFGYSPEEVIGRDVRILVPPTEAESGRDLVEMADKILENPDGFIENINENVRKNGEHAWVSWRNKAIRDSKGNVIGNLTIGQDITERKRAEEALKRAKNQFQVLTQNLSSGVALIDEHGRFSIVNPAFLRMFDLKEPSDIKNVNDRNWREWQVFDENGKLLDVDEHPIRKAAMTGKAVSNTLVAVRAPSGSKPQWMLISAAPILKPNGELDAVICTYHDVTELKQIEEAVRLSEDRLRFALETSHAGAWDLDLVDHTAYRSLEHDRIFGYTELLPQWTYEMFLDHVLPEDRAKVDAKFQYATATQSDWSFECRIRRTDGEVRWIWAAGRPRRDNGNTIRRMSGIVQDITDRKRMEEELRKSRDELEKRIEERTVELLKASLYSRSLIEASLDPLVTISTDGKITDVNRATELVTGIARGQLIGTDFSTYFTEPEKAREGYKRVFSEGSVRDYPLAIRHTSNRVTEVLYNATVYNNEAGKTQGVFAAARDITERKRTEEALRESESRLRFLSSQLLIAQEKERRRVAQEIHDSLGASLAAAKYKIEATLGQLGDVDPQTTGALKSIIPIVQGTIDEARRIQMALRPSILDDLGILATINWFCRQFESTYSHIRIGQEINIEESEVPGPLKTVIFRALQEALNNIAKHSKADHVNLLLRKTAGAVELGIQDNGQGFDLGEAYSRVGTTRGLGLESMRERVELSRGSFLIESRRGSGTVIRAKWPIEGLSS